jgi:hypothetical protein
MRYIYARMHIYAHTAAHTRLSMHVSEAYVCEVIINISFTHKHAGMKC